LLCLQNIFFQSHQTRRTKESFPRSDKSVIFGKFIVLPSIDYFYCVSALG
jgi:hypothetical protein